MITDTDLIVMYAENEKFRREKPQYRFRMPLDKRFEEYFGQIYGNDVTVKCIDKNGVRNTINGKVEHAFISGVFLYDKDNFKSSYFSYSTMVSIKKKQGKK